MRAVRTHMVSVRDGYVYVTESAARSAEVPG
jgi:hypothetical protein